MTDIDTEFDAWWESDPNRASEDSGTKELARKAWTASRRKFQNRIFISYAPNYDVLPIKFVAVSDSKELDKLSATIFGMVMAFDTVRMNDRTKFEVSLKIQPTQTVAGHPVVTTPGEIEFSGLQSDGGSV